MNALSSKIIAPLSLAITVFFCMGCTNTQDAVAPQELSLNNLFSDHMVLQRNAGGAFWGRYIPNETVTVTGSWGNEISGDADADGNWILNLATPDAGGPYEVTVSTQDTSFTYNDVLIGEVWLASGQSNMEMPLAGWPPNDPINNSAQEIASADYPSIRMFTVKRNFTMEPTTEFDGSWLHASPDTAEVFSATAYFFARRLHQELNVPIGIIHSSWGGTVAEAWTSSERLSDLGDFDEALTIFDNPNWKKDTEDWFGKWTQKAIPSNDTEWTALDLDDANVANPNFDDAAWEKINLPNRYDKVGDVELDGAFWFRKTITLDEVSGEYTLKLGAIDDKDVTYVNGQRVGSTNSHLAQRSYAVPSELLKVGENTLAIRAIDTGGPGSISGDVVELSSTSGQRHSLEGSWSMLPLAEIYDGQMNVYSTESSSLSERPNIQAIHANTPTVLYNAMINPLIPYTIKGSIWYQGESNVRRAEQYTRLFPTMIQDWRSRWDSDFPFYFVQIAPYKYHGGSDVSQDPSQRLRDAQRRSLSLENTGMVVTMDIGNINNIHPANKQDVGSRLAGLALSKDYGKDLVSSGPLYKSHETVDGKIRLAFDSVGTGLMASDTGLANFEIAGADGIFTPATALIDGDRIVVSAHGIADPREVRYAWRDKVVASLFNKEGLPASSFTTETNLED